MATTYTSTIDVRCWKEHTCVNCEGTFAYLFTRKVTGSANTEDGATANAQAAAMKAVNQEVDLHPCPTCGLYQPDMVGAQRARRHWWLFWLTLLYLAALLIAHGMAWLTADVMIWLAVAGCGLAVVAHLLVDGSNPNRDPEANRELTRRIRESGQLQLGQAGKDDTVAPELRSPSWSAMHRLAFVLMLVAVAGFTVPEVVRMMRGWPINPDFHPPVAGPGDETYVYLPYHITSVKGYWSGTAVVNAAVADNPGGGTFVVPSATKTSNWGGTIRAKSSEKSSNSQLWVTLHLPERADLAGKTLQLKITLTVTYPMSMGGGFNNQLNTFTDARELQLASANAGKEYNTLWWLGVLAGGGLLLAMNLGLIGIANALKKKAAATNVYPVNDDQGETGEEAPPAAE